MNKEAVKLQIAKILGYSEDAVRRVESEEDSFEFTFRVRRSVCTHCFHVDPVQSAEVVLKTMREDCLRAFDKKSKELANILKEHGE